MRVYAYQNWGFWSFTLEQWAAFVEQVISNDGEYFLPDERQIKTKPKSVYIGTSDHVEEYWSYKDRVVFPLDKPIDWFIEELKEIRMLIGRDT